MDDEILKTVEAVLGKDIEIVDCQKTKTVQEEEILLINGQPIKLEGNDAAAIKKALMTGQIPPCDLLNQILYQAGILRQPVHLETTLSVKSSLTTTEEIRVARNGVILDERSLETKEDNFYTSECSEVWEPIGKVTTSLKATNGVTDDYCLPSADENLTFIKRNKTSSSTQIPPMRQNSVCTNDSIYSSSASSSSRPTSDLSVNISNSDMNLYDNIQSYLINNHGHSTGSNVIHTSTSIDPKLNQSLSCDSGHHDYSLTSTTVNDEEYIIPSTATQSSIATQSSFNGTESDKTANGSAASIDEIDFQKCRINGQSALIKLKPQQQLV